MRRFDEMLEHVRVPPDKKIRLKDYDPAWTGDKKASKEQRKQLAENVLAQEVAELAAAQELLFASRTWAVLIILQAMDAAGKDSTIKHVMSSVNPQGCQVHPFKRPSEEELAHTFLWRCMKVLPARGHIGIFNRSYYEEVLVVKVHPEFLDGQRIPGAQPGPKLWEGRYKDINAFEKHLVRNGTCILKFFLYVSREEQRKRLLERTNDPKKHWKFNATDIQERQHWDVYMKAYEDALNATSTEHAPWHIIPADHKWFSRALVAKIVSDRIASLDLRPHEITPEEHRQIEEAKAKLEAEAE